jgi:hypothetical protein
MHREMFECELRTTSSAKRLWLDEPLVQTKVIRSNSDWLRVAIP